ncbi:MAG: hypothetical protein AAF918_18250 [Pseudomonadota bacterium]
MMRLKRITRLLLVVLMLSGLVSVAGPEASAVKHHSSASADSAPPGTTHRAYPLTPDHPLSFSLDPKAATLRLLSNAVLTTGEPAARYTLVIKLRDRSGRLLKLQRADHRAPGAARERRILEQGVAAATTLSSTEQTIVDLTAAPDTQRVEIALSSDRTQTVVLRSYWRDDKAQRPEHAVRDTTQRLAWDRLHVSKRTQLAAANVHASTYLNDREIERLMASRWRPLVPHGIMGSDFKALTLWTERGSATEIAGPASALAPAAVRFASYSLSDTALALPVADPAGRHPFRLDLRSLWPTANHEVEVRTISADGVSRRWRESLAFTGHGTEVLDALPEQSTSVRITRYFVPPPATARVEFRGTHGLLLSLHTRDALAAVKRTLLDPDRNTADRRPLQNTHPLTNASHQRLDRRWFSIDRALMQAHSDRRRLLRRPVPHIDDEDPAGLIATRTVNASHPKSAADRVRVLYPSAARSLLPVLLPAAGTVAKSAGRRYQKLPNGAAHSAELMPHAAGRPLRLLIAQSRAGALSLSAGGQPLVHLAAPVGSGTMDLPTLPAGTRKLEFDVAPGTDAYLSPPVLRSNSAADLFAERRLSPVHRSLKLPLPGAGRLNVQLFGTGPNAGTYRLHLSGVQRRSGLFQRFTPIATHYELALAAAPPPSVLLPNHAPLSHQRRLVFEIGEDLELNAAQLTVEAPAAVNHKLWARTTLAVSHGADRADFNVSYERVFDR